MIKETESFTEQADYINKSITAVSYNHFDDKTEDILAYIACIIKPFSESSFDEEREMIEGSEDDLVVKKLVDSISTRTLEQTIKDLLLEYERYEILNRLDF